MRDAAGLCCRGESVKRVASVRCTGESVKRVASVRCTGEFVKRVASLRCTGKFVKRLASVRCKDGFVKLVASVRCTGELINRVASVRCTGELLQGIAPNVILWVIPANFTGELFRRRTCKLYQRVIHASYNFQGRVTKASHTSELPPLANNAAVVNRSFLLKSTPQPEDLLSAISSVHIFMKRIQAIN